MIHVDDSGRPLGFTPERGDFPGGLEGTIAWLDARHVWNDRVASVANGAFDKAFRAAMKQSRKAHE